MWSSGFKYITANFCQHLNTTVAEADGSHSWRGGANFSVTANLMPEQLANFDTFAYLTGRNDCELHGMM